MSMLFKMGSDLVHSVMVHSNVQTLMNSGEKFDVCIIEVFNADAFIVRVTKSIQSKSNLFPLLRVSPIILIACLSHIQLLAPSSGLMI